MHHPRDVIGLIFPILIALALLWRIATLSWGQLAWVRRRNEQSVERFNKWIRKHEEEIESRQRAILGQYLTFPRPRIQLRRVTMREDARCLLLKFHYGPHPRVAIHPRRPTFVIVRDASHPQRLHALMVPSNHRSATGALAWCAQLSKRQYHQIRVEA